MIYSTILKLAVKFSEAFRETLFRFGIKGTDLAERSGLTTTQISRFRNGENLRIDSVERLIKALPQAAREYMLRLVLRDEDEDHVPLPIKNPLSESAEEGNQNRCVDGCSALNEDEAKGEG